MKFIYLCLLLAASAGIPVYGQSFKAGDLTYAVETEGGETYAKVTACEQVSSVTIPDVVSNEGTTYPVRKIGDYAFRDNSVLSSIVVGANVISVGQGAFHKCTSLHSFDFSNIKSVGYAAFVGSGIREASLGSLTEMGDYAFLRCGELKTLHLGAAVKLSRLPFLYCTSLGTVSVDAANPYYKVLDGVLFSNDLKTLVLYPAGRSLGQSKLRYQVPASVTTIGTGAMALARMDALVLPRGLKTIGDYAFAGIRLKALTIPESVDSFGHNPFANAVGNQAQIDRLVFLADNPVVWDETPGEFYNLPGLSTMIMWQTYWSEINAYVKPSALDTYKNTPPYDKGAWKFSSQLSFTSWMELMSAGFDFDLDFTGQDITAYTASSYDGSRNAMVMQPTQVDGYTDGKYVAMQAGTITFGGVDYDRFTGVILKGTPGTTYTFTIGEGKNKTLNNAENHLVGMPADFYVEPTETIDGTALTTYGLRDGKFRKYTRAGILSYSKAFMALPASWQVSAKTAFLFSDGGEATGIALPETEEQGRDDAPYYNLDGVRVEHPRKGVYIRNGKKVVIK